MTGSTRESRDREIASALEVGEETEKTHVGHVLATLRVEDRMQAAAQTLQRGLVSFDDPGGSLRPP